MDRCYRKRKMKSFLQGLTVWWDSTYFPVTLGRGMMGLPLPLSVLLSKEDWDPPGWTFPKGPGRLRSWWDSQPDTIKSHHSKLPSCDVDLEAIDPKAFNQWPHVLLPRRSVPGLAADRCQCLAGVCFHTIKHRLWQLFNKCAMASFLVSRNLFFNQLYNISYVGIFLFPPPVVF